MRFLFLLTQSLESPSGGGRFLPLARALAAEGHTVEIVALHHDWAMLLRARRWQRVDGVTVRYVGQMHVLKRGDTKRYFSPPRLLWVALRGTLALAWAALRVPADVVMVGKPHPMNAVAGWLASRLRRRPLWLDMDDNEAESNRFGGAWQRRGVALFERWLPRQAKWVTTNTRASLARAHADGVPEGRLLLVPNGITLPMPVSEESEIETLRAVLGDGPVVLYLGSLSLPSHPVHLLVEGWPRVSAAHPEAMLAIVGGGEELERLRAQARALGVEGSVRFVGRVPPEAVWGYYRLAALTVDPLYNDPAAAGRAPLKLLESLACGTPVVTSDIGERAALLGEAGALAPAGDGAALGRAIAELLADPARLRRMAERAPGQVEPYDWARLARPLLDVLTELPSPEARQPHARHDRPAGLE